MAFVVPAEIGHATYAPPVIQYLADHFETLHLVAVRNKLFPELSADCWLLYAAGKGGSTGYIRLTAYEEFKPCDSPPTDYARISLAEWGRWGRRLRPFLLPTAVREVYESAQATADAQRLGDIARVGIGYVTGDNDFFHLRPSEAERMRIPNPFLVPAVRNGRVLPSTAVTRAVVQRWISRDEPVLLLRIRRGDDLPLPVTRYLESDAGHAAQQAYKCRTRDPWYSVPDVIVPDAFMPCMVTSAPSLVANQANCVGTNSVHVVVLRNGVSLGSVQQRWKHPLVALSAELEGHPLGGGLLKLEPREAANLLLPLEGVQDPCRDALVMQGVETMRRWRHHG